MSEGLTLDEQRLLVTVVGYLTACELDRKPTDVVDQLALKDMTRRLNLMNKRLLAEQVAGPK